MQIDLSWTGLGVIVAIVVHIFYTVRWASKVEFKLGAIADTLVSMSKEFDKRDVQISAAWKQIDSIRDRVVKIEAVCQSRHKED